MGLQWNQKAPVGGKSVRQKDNLARKAQIPGNEELREREKKKMMLEISEIPRACFNYLIMFGEDCDSGKTCRRDEH